MTTALALRRCGCGTPIDYPQGSGRIAMLCAACQSHALVHEWTKGRDIPEGGGPKTSDEWIAAHAYEWETQPSILD